MGSKSNRRGIAGIISEFAASFINVPEQVPERAGDDSEKDDGVPEHTGTLPEWMTTVPESKKQFVTLVKSGGIASDRMRTSDKKAGRTDDSNG